MKLPYLPTLISMALAMNAGAAVYSNNFDSFAIPGEVAGTDSWVISDPSPDISFTVNYDDLTNPASTAAALGGLNSSTTQATVGLGHSYNEELGRTSATFGFSLIDSTGGGFLRDKFAFSFYDGATNVFSVIFTPVQANPDLDAPGDEATWHLSYSANGAAEEDLFIDVFDDAPYTFDLAFSPSPGGVNTNGVFTIGGDFDPLVRNIPIFGVAPDTIITDFALEWKPTDLPSGGGDGYIIIDNLTVVPEPSSALLVGLAGLAFVSNRRRRA